MNVSASNISNKIHQLFSKQRILGVQATVVQRKISGDLTLTFFWIIFRKNKIILFWKWKTKSELIFFSFVYEKEKWMRALKWEQSKILWNMEIIVSYLNFTFHMKVKIISKHKYLNIVFQFIKNTKWYFEY